MSEKGNSNVIGWRVGGGGGGREEGWFGVVFFTLFLQCFSILLCTLFTCIILVTVPTSLVAQIQLRFLSLVSFVTYKIPTAIKDYFPTISKLNVHHRQQLCRNINHGFTIGYKNLAYAPLINNIFAGGSGAVVFRSLWYSRPPSSPSSTARWTAFSSSSL
jgi:hypothetical protein